MSTGASLSRSASNLTSHRVSALRFSSYAIVYQSVVPGALLAPSTTPVTKIVGSGSEVPPSVGAYTMAASIATARRRPFGPGAGQYAQATGSWFGPDGPSGYLSV